MKIAPDVERLMWMAAESGDPRAVEDFESRFPHLRYELAKRIDMVRALKASGKSIRHEGSIPRFTPPTGMGSPIGPRIRWSVAALALSALAFGSYFATRELMRPGPPPKDAVVSSPAVPGPQDAETQPVPEKEVFPEPEIQANSGIQSPDDEPPIMSPLEKRHTVRLQKVGLATALKAIGAQCGLKLEIPPDMPNDEIVVDYRNMTGPEILADMGAQFGFTAFDQGDGSVIIVPTRGDDGGEGTSRVEPPKNRQDKLAAPNQDRELPGSR